MKEDSSSMSNLGSSVTFAASFASAWLLLKEEGIEKGDCRELSSGWCSDTLLRKDQKKARKCGPAKQLNAKSSIRQQTRSRRSVFRPESQQEMETILHVSHCSDSHPQRQALS